jgi:hypothetical protein
MTLEERRWGKGGAGDREGKGGGTGNSDDGVALIMKLGLSASVRWLAVSERYNYPKVCPWLSSW